MIATSHTLFTYYTILYFTILYCTILYYTILNYTILYYTILHYTILYILYYTILYYSWGKRLCHACWKLMLESKIKQFYHSKSENSAIYAYDKSRRLLWISCCWFCIYFKRLLLTTSNDCFCNVKKIFLTTIVYMTTRDAFMAARNLYRIGLKRYLMNRSSSVLLLFLF